MYLNINLFSFGKPSCSTFKIRSSTDGISFLLFRTTTAEKLPFILKKWMIKDVKKNAGMQWGQNGNSYMAPNKLGQIKKPCLIQGFFNALVCKIPGRILIT